MAVIDLTPTQRRIIDLLSDGMAHTREEVHSCLNDELAELGSIRVHISRLNKILAVKGHEIVCVRRGYQTLYRHMRHISTGE